MLKALEENEDITITAASLESSLHEDLVKTLKTIFDEMSNSQGRYNQDLINAVKEFNNNLTDKLDTIAENTHMIEESREEESARNRRAAYDMHMQEKLMKDY